MHCPKKIIETTVVASGHDGNGQIQVANCTRIWPEYGYFKQQPCDFHMDKDNFQENSVIYINQGYLSVKDNKRMFHADYYILGQIIEVINPLGNIQNYAFKDREVNFYCPCYDPQTGQFLALYDCIGYLIVRE